MADAAVRIGALLLPDDTDRMAAKPAETAHDGLVLREFAVAGERGEIGHETVDIVAEMRAQLVARDLGLLPRCQSRIEVDERLLGLGLEPRQLVADRHGIALLPELAQFLDLGFEFGDRLFEIEIATHRHGAEVSEFFRKSGQLDGRGIGASHACEAGRTLSIPLGEVKLCAARGLTVR